VFPYVQLTAAEKRTDRKERRIDEKKIDGKNRIAGINLLTANFGQGFVKFAESKVRSETAVNNSRFVTALQNSKGTQT
jgi:hypothetical protein